jgi:hypothetical protein
VAAAANGDRQLVFTAEIHGRDHVGCVDAARDQERPLVDHGVIEFPGVVVARIAPPDQRSAKTLAEFGDGIIFHDAPPKKETLKHRLSWTLNANRTWWG